MVLNNEREQVTSMSILFTTLTHNSNNKLKSLIIKFYGIITYIMFFFFFFIQAAAGGNPTGIFDINFTEVSLLNSFIRTWDQIPGSSFTSRGVTAYRCYNCQSISRGIIHTIVTSHQAYLGSALLLSPRDSSKNCGRYFSTFLYLSNLNLRSQVGTL